MPLLQTFDLGKGEHGWSQRIRIPAFFNKTVSAVSLLQLHFYSSNFHFIIRLFTCFSSASPHFCIHLFLSLF